MTGGLRRRAIGGRRRGSAAEDPMSQNPHVRVDMSRLALCLAQIFSREVCTCTFLHRERKNVGFRSQSISRVVSIEHSLCEILARES